MVSKRFHTGMTGFSMASFTIKNVPEELLERLREEAERSHRSLNRQVIETLERQLMPRKLDVAALVERARGLRARGPRGLTIRELDELRRAGRA